MSQLTIDDVIDLWPKTIYSLDLAHAERSVLLSFAQPERLIPDGRGVKLAISIPDHMAHKVTETHAGRLIAALKRNGIVVSSLATCPYTGPSNGTGAKTNGSVHIERADPPDTSKITRNEIVHKFDVNRGFMPIPHYATRFWQPLVGAKAFSLWNTLLTYAYACKTYDQPWPSTKRMANTLGLASGTSIVGTAGMKERRGLIHTLQEFRMATFKLIGEPPTVRYHFLVTEYLDLLTPYQVGLLRPSKQKEHMDYLTILERKTKGNLSIAEWNLIAVDNLVPELVFDEN